MFEEQLELPPIQGLALDWLLEGGPRVTCPKEGQAGTSSPSAVAQLPLFSGSLVRWADPRG